MIEIVKITRIEEKYPIDILDNDSPGEISKEE